MPSLPQTDTCYPYVPVRPPPPAQAHSASAKSQTAAFSVHPGWWWHTLHALHRAQLTELTAAPICGCASLVLLRLPERLCLLL